MARITAITTNSRRIPPHPFAFDPPFFLRVEVEIRVPFDPTDMPRPPDEDARTVTGPTFLETLIVTSLSDPSEA
jgi:hypothetical protein